MKEGNDQSVLINTTLASLHASLHGFAPCFAPCRSLARSLAHPPIFPINYSDVATVELAEGNMASFVSDMERDLAFERLQIDKVLDAARRRGGDFFERRLALTKVPELIVDPGKFKEDFREAVLRGVDAQIDEVVTDVAVLVEERSRNQARAVLDFLGRRPGKHAESMVGSLHDSHFDGARFQVVAKLQAEVKAAMKEYDREAEAARLQDTVRSSLQRGTTTELVVK